MEQGAIGIQQGPRSGPNNLEMLERQHTQALGRVRRDHAVEVVQPPDRPRQVRRGDDPAAAQTAKPVSFGEAAGDDEAVAKPKRGARRPGKVHLAIHLVDQDVSPDLRRHGSDRAQRILTGYYAAGIMRAGDGDQASARRQGLLDRLRVERKGRLRAPRLKAALEPLGFRAQISRPRQQRLVGWMFDQHLVPGLERRGHRQVVGHGRPGGGDDALGGNADLGRQRLLKGRVAVETGPAQLQVLEPEFAARRGDQLGERVIGDAAHAEVEPGPGPRLDPLEVLGARDAPRWRGLDWLGSCSIHRWLLCPPHRKYTGIPASTIPRPMALCLGNRTTVFATTSQQAAVNSTVVSGWPGMRNATRCLSADPTPRASRRRNTKMQVAVNPKKMKSVETT